MENNHHIDRIFKSAVERYELRPSDDVWNRIERELDQSTATTHTRISVYRYAAMVMLFLAVALLSMPGGRQSSRFTAFDAAEALSGQPVQIASLDAPVQVLINDATQVAAAMKQHFAPRETGLAEEPTLKTFTADLIPLPGDQEEFIFLPPVPEDETVYAESKDIFERIYNTDEPLNVMAYNYFGDDEEGDEEMAFMETPAYKARYRDLDMRGMYIGVSGSYNQTSLLEYGNAFAGSRPIQPSLKFGTTKGVKFGYNINNNFGVEAEYVYNALQGQNYVMSEDDEIVEKSLSLSYDLIPVVAKVKVGRISDITNQPIVMNYTAGMQYGMLREARMPQDKRYEESAEELFRHNDISLVLGVEYDVYLQDNIVVSAGARGTFSNDISTHIEPLNDYAKRNFVFGLRGSVSYVFR